MPNGTFFKLEVGFSPIHLTSISAYTSEPVDLSKLTEEELRITKNIVSTIRRLADIIERQGLNQSTSMAASMVNTGGRSANISAVLGLSEAINCRLAG